ncbi:MAG TPA: hypothetical protein VEW66_02830, partial [Thermomicrobiales bacterium]|nr:hypothetical protein [Thermomicrobiales bacterium]
FILSVHLLAAEVSFELAEEVIDAEAPPCSFDEYTRVNLDDDSSSADDLLCYEDRALSVFDLNDDGVITIDELEEFAGDPDVDDVIDLLDNDSYDGIEYKDCLKDQSTSRNDTHQPAHATLTGGGNAAVPGPVRGE